MDLAIICYLGHSINLYDLLHICVRQHGLASRYQIATLCFHLSQQIYTSFFQVKPDPPKV